MFKLSLFNVTVWESSNLESVYLKEILGSAVYVFYNVFYWFSFSYIFGNVLRHKSIYSATSEKKFPHFKFFFRIFVWVIFRPCSIVTAVVLSAFLSKIDVLFLLFLSIKKQLFLLLLFFFLSKNSCFYFFFFFSTRTAVFCCNTCSTVVAFRKQTVEGKTFKPEEKLNEF